MVAYDWQKFYETAVLESNPAKIEDRVAEARQAIQQRLSKGPSLEIDATELATIDEALAALMVLKLEMTPEDSGDDPELSGENAA